jgi:3',5'-cyclic-AMP phosphodiesterase
MYIGGISATTMTRFAFLTDTHLGAVSGVGYMQQPRYADRLQALLSLLEDWNAHQDGESVDFVLHGGDMVDVLTAATLGAAREAFSLTVPVYLALGNHDLTGTDSAAMWMAEAPEFFPGGHLAYTLGGAGWMLHVLPTQWCEKPYTWDDVQNPHFLPEHTAALEASLAQHPDLVHLICTHAEVLPVPAAQTGYSEPYHRPLPAYRDGLADLVQRFPQIRGIIGGHNHINTHGYLGAAHAVTASAFPEAPFEFKVFDVGADHLAMQTVSLMRQVEFPVDYDWGKTFVQGRHCDRTFDWQIPGEG